MALTYPLGHRRVQVAPGAPGLDVGAPRFSRDWWLARLESRLVDRRGSNLTGTRRMPAPQFPDQRPTLMLLDAYLRGRPPLPPGAEHWETAMQEFQAMSRTNYAALLVSSKTRRMLPIGFRTAAENDKNGDLVAAEVYRANQLDAAFGQCFGWALGLGSGYMMVGAIRPDADDIPLVTAEHPFEMITADDPATGVARAALKQWHDEWEDADFSLLLLPGERHLARRDQSRWVWDDGESGAWPEEMGLKETVPAFHFRGSNNGRGEIEPHLDLLDRINHGIFQRIVIQAYQAFRQRAITGAPDTDQYGNEIDYGAILTTDPGAFWRLPEGVEFWESSQIDLRPVLDAIKWDVEALAAVTSTPLYSITPDAANGSAEGASLQREQTVFAVLEHRRSVTAQLARVMATAFRVMGDQQRAEVTKIETIWQPAERYGLAERYDAAVKAVSAGEPWGSIGQNILQYTPEEMEWIDQQRLDDLLLAPVNAVGAGGQGPNANQQRPAVQPSQQQQQVPSGQEFRRFSQSNPRDRDRDGRVRE